MDNNALTKREQIINELMVRQIETIPENRKLFYDDMQRILRYITESIFTENECVLWNGYITNEHNNKGTYINFYFNGKKMALHRILYENYVGELQATEYIRYNCENRGKCCNINHMKKYGKKTEQKEEDDEIVEQPIKKENNDLAKYQKEI